MSHDLLVELQRLLQAEFAQTGYRRHPARPEVYVPPLVMLYAIPARRAQAHAAGPGGDEQSALMAALPFIVLRPGFGEDGAEEDGSRTETVEVTFTCGVFTDGDEASGARDLDSLMARIRRLLMRNRLYLSRYERLLPISWDVGDGADHAQPHPVYGGRIRAKFAALAALETMTLEEEDRVYGLLAD